MARGIIAIGDMMATSISKTSVALGGALNNYANAAMNRSPALSEPLTLSKSYVSRYVQRAGRPGCPNVFLGSASKSHVADAPSDVQRLLQQEQALRSFRSRPKMNPRTVTEVI
jgi:hypothetical protein